jgi:O-antigen ligase/tetratricopeptide (TPR) repeat protein
MISSRSLSNVVSWLLLISVVLVPLVFWSGVLFSYTPTKTILFRTLIEIAAIFWIPLIIWHPEYRPKRSLLTIAVSVFFSILVLTALTGQNFRMSFWSGYERMLGIWTYLHIYVFFLMLVSVVRTKKDWHRIFSLLVGAAFLVSGIGIVESFSDSGRITSTIGNAAFLAAYLALALVLAAWLFVQTWSSIIYRILYIGVIVVMTWALYLTEARASIIGVLAGIFCVFGIIAFTKTEAFGNTFFAPRLLKRGVIAIILVGILGGIGALFFGSPSTEEGTLGRLAAIRNLTDRTIEARLLTWQVTWEGWKEKFLLGWGVENYAILFDKHYDARMYNQEPWFDRAHNVVLDIGATTGIIGFLAYLGIFVMAVMLLWRAFQQKSIDFSTYSLSIAFLIVYLTQGMFTFDTLNSYVVVFGVLAYISSLSLLSEKDPIQHQKRVSKFFLVGVAIIIGMVWYVGNWLPFRENMIAKAGYNMLAELKGDDAAIRIYEEALTYQTFGDVDVRRSFVEYIFEFIKQGGKRPQESLQKLMTYGMQKMEENIAADPQNVKWFMYQGQLYSLATSLLGTNQAAKAEEYFTRAKALSPNRSQIYFELAQARKLQGNIPGMWEAMDYVLAQVPAYAVAHVNAAVHAIEVNDTEREKTEVQWLMDNFSPSDVLRNTYFKVKRYSDAAKFQELLIQTFYEGGDHTNEEYAVEYARLAAIYQLAGDKEKARAAAQKVVEYDPNRKAEAEAFLNSL